MKEWEILGLCKCEANVIEKSRAGGPAIKVGKIYIIISTILEFELPINSLRYTNNQYHNFKLNLFKFINIFIDLNQKFFCKYIIKS